MIIGRLHDLMRGRDGDWIISISTKSDVREEYDKLSGQDIKVDIKKYYKKRTKTANDFCWALCTDIGNALSPPIPKEEVYRNAIRDVGVYSTVLLKEEEVEIFKRNWSSKGDGWFVNVIDDSKKNPGCKVVFAYYGTSTYDSAEMGRVLEYLVQDAREMGLSIPTNKEQEEMLLAWSSR